jgi:S1-C subfamily serine protease
MFFCGLLCAGVLALLLRAAPGGQAQLTQEDIDAAVLHTLETQSLPSRPARAAEAVRRSVVRVRGYPDTVPTPTKPEGAVPKADTVPSPQERPRNDGGKAPGRQADAAKPGAPRDGERGAKPGAPSGKNEAPDEDRGSVGSGVVVVEDGTILTNFHVISGSKRLVVTFFDGFESEATVVGVQPDKDLAVIKAKSTPDDLPPATLGSTANLRPGDEVVAVGFPFGIGPSVSSGVVSGLDRAFVSPQGKQELTKLIQFDAAANPGNSGGPLVSMDGEVVGIVTAILNPTEAHTFIGIGFATTIESAGSAVGIPPF